ncbi:MAG: diversity-generating retroelement protein Avd, partial [Gemmataceae bacterium]|nr:diversity-generating retroelement protein Avd [Gemmataceae bacterium]
SMADELPVIQKAYDLVKWACEHVGRFPRKHRFTLGERIERRLYDLLEGLVAARWTKERAGLLREANRSLELLRWQMRLAHDLRCLRASSYEFASRELHGLGAMVGGWTKAQRD